MPKIKEKSKKVVVDRGWRMPRTKRPLAYRIIDWFINLEIIAGAVSVIYFIYKLIIN